MSPSNEEKRLSSFTEGRGFVDSDNRLSIPSMFRPPCHKNGQNRRGDLDSSTHQTASNHQRVYFSPIQNQQDSCCSPAPARRSWTPMSCPTGNKKSVKGRFSSIPKPPIHLSSDGLHQSEHRTDPRRGRFSIPSSPQARDLIRTLNKTEFENLPPAFQVCLSMKKQREGEKPQKIPASPRHPRAIPPPSNLGQKLKVEVTIPRKLDIQWPPKMPATTSYGNKKPIDLPCFASTRNASIRIRWLGGTTMRKNDKLEENSDPRGSHPQLTSNGAIRGYMRPDVWATPLLCNSGNNTQKTWRVKRVWNNDSIDEHEREHEVLYEHLMDKVKELLGVPGDDQERKVQEYDSTASEWMFDRVYDVNGQVKGRVRSKDTDEAGVLKEMEEVSDLAVKWSYCEGGVVAFDESTDWEAFELIPAEDSPLGKNNEADNKQDRESLLLHISDRPMTNTSPCGRELWKVTTNCSEHNSQCDPWEAQEVKVVMKADRDSRPIAQKVKKGTDDDNEPQSIFDLLSPPPVYFWGLDENDLLDMGLIAYSKGQE